MFIEPVETCPKGNVLQPLLTENEQQRNLLYSRVRIKQLLSRFYFAKKCNGKAGLVCIEVDDNVHNLNRSCRNRTVAEKESVTFDSDVFTSVNKSTKQKRDAFNMPARVNEFGNK